MSIIEQLKTIDLNGVVLVVLLVTLAIYSGYAFLVFKQVRILNKSIHTSAAGSLDTLAFAHLLFSLGLLGLTVLIFISLR